MFELRIYDRKGNELQLGDKVAISDGRHINFFAEVKWLEKEEILAPFHTFSFHSMQKVDSVPPDAVKTSEERYNIWYIPEKQEDNEWFEDYLKSWRECEIALEKSMFRITPKTERQLNLF